MGYDISYHPIKESEINEWYFDILNNKNQVDQLAEEYNIQDFYTQKYKDTMAVATSTQPSNYFDKTHGYYIAVVQGFFREFFYTRGSAFSFLIDHQPEFKSYTKTWQEILGDKINNPVENKIIENYSSGVYISAGQVEKLLTDYKENEDIRIKLDNFYSHKRINVFLKALECAKENNAGLLEATEVIEPQPLDLNKSICYSNLFNCDKEGALLYREAAMEQIREIEERENLAQGTIANNAEYQKVYPEDVKEKEKKGFWKRLFGK